MKSFVNLGFVLIAALTVAAAPVPTNYERSVSGSSQGSYNPVLHARSDTNGGTGGQQPANNSHVQQSQAQAAQHNQPATNAQNHPPQPVPAAQVQPIQAHHNNGVRRLSRWSESSSDAGHGNAHGESKSDQGHAREPSAKGSKPRNSIRR
ncbi:hypothetical protein PIIN_04663 [Serendipita indica DSM 11827]|uniref:Uncharacterized protein n=1 Tax=Serendipita indica (strain DSM 11827) TaxID=1109443 RepID=G4THD8_SERID|nr:hypothetical protein PIIN_04663 [Serendipita indica DSM 11827]